MKQSIFECQPGMYCLPTGEAHYADPYVYVGYDRESGLHIFEQALPDPVERIGSRQLFRRTRSAPACWHLKRGAWCFEFVRR